MTQAQHAQLTTHVFNIRHRGRAWVRTGLNSVLLRWQTESVITQSVQNVLAQHAVIARKDVSCDITQWVTNVKTRTGRIREHVLDKELVLRQWLISG